MRGTNAPIDFDAIIARIKENGGFRDYDASKFPNPAPEDWHFPKHMGEALYSTQNYMDRLSKKNYPQVIIDANNQSFRDAVTTYMSKDAIAQWMHEYFAGDFLRSKILENQIADINAHFVAGGVTPNAFSARTKHENRRNRVLFAPLDIATAADICLKFPAMALAVVAYQAALVTYLYRLKEAISSSTALNEDERERGAKIIAALEYATAVSSPEGSLFLDNILPAIALKYNERDLDIRFGESMYANEDEQTPPAQEDFIAGMQAANAEGMFTHDITGEDGVTRHFSCPARTMLLSASQNQPEIGEDTGAAETGIALYHIYRIIDRQLNAQSPDAPPLPALTKLEEALNQTFKQQSRYF